jgi:putative nucleotidyltransferase with HDIG domain
MFDNNAPTAMDKRLFWRHTIVCALIGKSIARRFLNEMMMDLESTFCAGILHDIGRLIFDQFTPKEYALACALAKKENISLVEAERKALGITHAEVGRILADKWALPPDLENAIVWHHEPQHAETGKELTAIIHLADVLSHTVDVGLWEGEKTPPEWENARTFLDVSDVDWAFFVNEAKASIEKSDDFFSIMQKK